MDFLIQSDLPYPDTDTGVKSIEEVRLIMPAYGDRESETTAIMGYIYQTYVLKPNYPEIADVIERIGMTEMHHHELLGNLVVSLGGTPVIGGNYTYWQGGFVNYTRDVRKIINDDILAEKRAIAAYKNIIRASSNETVKTVIERIIVDEEIHVETLTGIKRMLEQNGD